MDSRSYLSALLCDELGEEGTEAPGSPKQVAPVLNTHSANHSGEEEMTSEGNPYLRPPRKAAEPEDSMLF